MDFRILENIKIAIRKIEDESDWSFFNEIILATTTHDGQMDFLKNSYQIFYPDPASPEYEKATPLEKMWGVQTLKENALHPGNGFGKTTIIARKHIFFILKHSFDPELANKGNKYKTLNVAITQDQAELVQDEILRLAQNAPFLNGWFLENSVKFPHAKIKYFSGAITEFKTTKKKGESIEGKEYGYISCDEIALEQHLEFIRESILRPRLRMVPDSQMDFSATPKGIQLRKPFY
jgi:hypothetical protein